MSPSADEFDNLQTQMKIRINEGQGETIYEIGTGGICFQLHVHVYMYHICSQVDAPQMVSQQKSCQPLWQPFIALLWHVELT